MKRLYNGFTIYSYIYQETLRGLNWRGLRGQNNWWPLRISRMKLNDLGCPGLYIGVYRWKNLEHGWNKWWWWMRAAKICFRLSRLAACTAQRCGGGWMKIRKGGTGSPDYTTNTTSKVEMPPFSKPHSSFTSSPILVLPWVMLPKRLNTPYPRWMIALSA